MNDHDYKNYLMNRVKQYLGDNYIDFKVHHKDKGEIYLFEIGNTHNIPSLIYYPFEARARIPSTNETFESIIKEKVVILFKERFKE